MTVRIQVEPLSPGALLDAFAHGRADAGAVVSFTGVVRAKTDDKAVTRLYLDAYPRVTLPVIEAMAAEAAARFELRDVLVVHRYGDITPGEAVVFVAAAAEHRRAAFAAVDFLMDRLKVAAPFWKKEQGPDGARWIEARADDHRDVQRWEKT